MNPKINAFKQQFDRKAPEFYYHSLHKAFLFKQTEDDSMQNWIEVGESMAVKVLQTYGISGKEGEDSELSPAEKMLMDKVMNSSKSVQYAGPVAGYYKGFGNLCGVNALVTCGPNMPVPAKGNWADIKAIMEGLFGYMNGVQLPFVYSYLKLSRYMLVHEIRRGMPALILVGSANCGKSFFQQYILTPLIGGRHALANRFIRGETTFNSDLCKAEHLMVMDPELSCRTSDRRELGERIKDFVANDTQSMHAKFEESLSMTPFLRLSMSVNPERENIMGLPPMVKSLRDKVMLLRCQSFSWPVFARTVQEIEDFKKLIYSQIPAFCWWLDNEYEVPYELTVDHETKLPARFGINCYQDPEIVRMLREVTPEYRLLELIWQCYFSVPEVGGTVSKPTREGIAMSALELELGLTSNDSPVRHEARSLLSNGGRITTYLSRLSELYPSRVFLHRTAKTRTWHINDIGSMLDTEGEGWEH